MSAITDWLNSNRNFVTGVKLYADHGGKKFYIDMFNNAGPTDFNRKKLVSEIQKLAPKESAKPAKLVPSNTVQKAEPPKPVDHKADNRKYLDLLKKKGTLYTQLNVLITEKRFIPDGDKLRETAFSILKTKQQLDECWAMIDYYQEHQRFPESKPPVKVDDNKRAQNIRVSIWKAKKRLDNPKCRDRDKTELLLKNLETELSQITNSQPE